MAAKDEDTKILADSYQAVDDAAGAFMKSMEASMPYLNKVIGDYKTLVEARQKRKQLREAFRIAHMEITK